MSFELSFSPEFFLQEGEPYDGGPDPSDKPTSVWHAIESLRALNHRRFAEMACEHFGIEPEFLTTEAVLDAVKETSRCSNLSTPVRVWVDKQGFYILEVW